MVRQAGLTASRRTVGGFTLVELMIVMAVVSIIVAMIGATVINSMRVSEQERTLIEMDTNATTALNGLSAVLRRGVLPIATGSSSTSGFQGAVNDKTRGFGRNGKAWAKQLQYGSDLLVFTIPIDADGDGDTLDADFLPELGITNVLGQAIPAASYTSAGKLSGNLNPSLAEMEPDDFGLNTNATDIDLTGMRFADSFEFPTAGTSPAYGVIRFVPMREHGQPIIMDEKVMKWDINEDDDSDDKFVVGHLEVCYPGRSNAFKAERKYLSRSSVLLQLNRDGDGWEPLFRLSRYKEGDKSENMDSMTGTPSAGDFTLHVKLLLCDRIGQRGQPVAFNSRLPFLARKFDRVIVLRNMSIR